MGRILSGFTRALVQIARLPVPIASVSFVSGCKIKRRFCRSDSVGLRSPLSFSARAQQFAGRPHRKYPLEAPMKIARWFVCGTLLAFATAYATDVTTFHNSNSRTGQNLQETILTQGNVNSATFGKLFTMSVDSTVDGEPLYLSGLSVAGKTHNVLFVVTENDSVYAFDADSGAQLWKVRAVLSGESASDTRGCSQITPSIGITSTPVIDRSEGAHGTIYVVAMSKDKSGNYYQRLHALDVTTGAEEFGGPVTITGSYSGNGAGSHSGTLTFDPKQYAERAGLLLLNGQIYLAWTSHCDIQPYTGWVMAYDESKLTQTYILNLTPNGSEGSVWQSGGGLATDGSNIFFLDANGTFDTTLDSNGFPSLGDYGNAFIKLNPSLTVKDYFATYNTVTQSDEDEDFGSGGAILPPPQTDSKGKSHSLAIGAGKDGNIYIVDRNNMGKFNSSSNNIYQEIDGQLGGGCWSVPAYFSHYVYFGPQSNRMAQFKFTNATLSSAPLYTTPHTFSYPGTTPSVSANSGSDGIVWAVNHTTTSVLHAYKAGNISNELYNSSQASGNRDHFGTSAHFGTPMIVNGKVYVGTTNSVVAFGLLSSK
jgi:hypothetical protein